MGGPGHARDRIDSIDGDTFSGSYRAVVVDGETVQIIEGTLVDTGFELDAIICNAGVMALPRLETKHGYELQFFTNHIGHFILVTGLLDRLSASGRVVMLSSDLHKMAPKVGIEFDNLDGARGTAGGETTGSRSSPTSCSPCSSRIASPARSGPPTPCIPG